LIISEGAKGAWWRKNPQTLLLALSGLLTALGFLSELSGLSHLVVKPLFAAAVASGIYYPARMGILALRTLTFNIRLLMTVGAIFLGLWEEAALLVVIYSFGDVLETYAVDKARGSIKALMELAPKEALVRRNSSEIMLPTAEIVIGDIAIVKPGERIPIDGRVAGGASVVDQAPITGESIPVEKKAGDEIFAGTINQRGSLEVAVTKQVSDTTLARIIHSVEEAQAKKPPTSGSARSSDSTTPLPCSFSVSASLLSHPLCSGSLGILISTRHSFSLSFPVPAASHFLFPLRWSRLLPMAPAMVSFSRAEHILRSRRS
jgi:Cd2+/Zn2+-exporting ATPase